jgi:hypothetical protein
MLRIISLEPGNQRIFFLVQTDIRQFETLIEMNMHQSLGMVNNYYSNVKKTKQKPLEFRFKLQKDKS